MAATVVASISSFMALLAMEFDGNLWQTAVVIIVFLKHIS